MTTYPDGTIVYTPYPDNEVTDPPTGANIVRTTYRLTGQIVAVQTKVGTAAATFYYTYTDHLGNITAMSTTAGAYVTGSKARYDPFGTFTTTTPTSNPSISNHGFTGHRHNNTGTNDLDLIYMNARYYMPLVGRFISPDTFVPDPGNPQSYNRYSYALNSPMNYTDPTGHCVTGIVVDTVTCVVVGALAVTAIYVVAAPDPSVIEDAAAALTNTLFQLNDYIHYVASGGNKGSLASIELMKQLAGNVATSPGNFDPNDFNKNPKTEGEWRSGSGYRENYEEAYGVTRDSTNYELHHILPQEYRETMRQAGINVDHPAFLREIRVTDPVTNVRVHQRLYTDVWANWRAGLGHNPAAQEIFNFARSLEEQYSLEGTLFYRQGPGLPGEVFIP